MNKMTNIHLPDILMKFFQNSLDKIFIFDRHSQIIALNDAAKNILPNDVFNELISGHTKAICTVCEGYTTEDEMQTCQSCYLFDREDDINSFQVYLDTIDEGTVPYSASLQTIDNELAIRMLILRDVTEQMKTQEQLYQKLQMNRIIEAQENERKRISRELHDSFAQELLSLLVEIRLMKYVTKDQKVISHMRQAEDKLADLLEDIQHLSVELRPSALDNLGLEAAFRSHFKMIEKNYGLIVNFVSNIKEKRYSGTIETNIYRICQEAVLNALKYARVDEIYVHLIEKNDTLYLTVEDHGIGFVVEGKDPQGSGLGLYGMKERAELLHGLFSLHSMLNKGTIVKVEVPLLKEKEK